VGWGGSAHEQRQHTQRNIAGVRTTQQQPHTVSIALQPIAPAPALAGCGSPAGPVAGAACGVTRAGGADAGGRALAGPDDGSNAAVSASSSASMQSAGAHGPNHNQKQHRTGRRRAHAPYAPPAPANVPTGTPPCCVQGRGVYLRHAMGRGQLQGRPCLPPHCALGRVPPCEPLGARRAPSPAPRRCRHVHPRRLSRRAGSRWGTRHRARRQTRRRLAAVALPPREGH
jgi:hypothetical protein